MNNIETAFIGFFIGAAAGAYNSVSAAMKNKEDVDIGLFYETAARGAMIGGAAGLVGMPLPSLEAAPYYGMMVYFVDNGLMRLKKIAELNGWTFLTKF